MNKYIGKYRVIVIEKPKENNKYYNDAITRLNKYKKKFDMLSTVVKVNDGKKFTIKLYGVDGKLKHKIIDFSGWNKIVDIISSMPMQKNISKLTLYADYHPSTSKKGFGFKNKEVAQNTIKIVEKLDKYYQFLIINTMYNRAKHHPHQTIEMRDAMVIFKKWLNKYK